MSCYRCIVDFCTEDQEAGVLSGAERIVPGIDETLTTYFHHEFHRKRFSLTKLAVVFYDKKLTFQALQHQSTAVANHLKTRLGSEFVSKNPDYDLVVCLCLPPSEKLIVLIFAILKMGGTYLPVDPNYPPSVILQILKSFLPIMMIHDETRPLPKDSSMKDLIVTTVDEIWTALGLNNESADIIENLKGDKLVDVLVVPEEMRASERPAVIIHTTGLHNIPRGVRISHPSIMNRITWTWRNLPFMKCGACCLNVPVTFVDSLNQIFSPLLRGVTLNIYKAIDVLNMSTLIEKLESDKITRISLSPVVLGKFLNECHIIGRDEARMRLKELKFVSCKGEILNYDLAKQFFKAFPADDKILVTAYGYTELCGDVICEKFKNIREVQSRFVSGHIVLGQVMDNARFYILDVNHELVVNLEKGEICIGGTPLAMGYVNKKSKDFNFINNPYDTSQKHCRLFITGDFGRLVICRDRRSRLLFEGRGDSFLRHNGYEFVIEDIKDALKDIEGVDHVNIFIFHPGKSDQTVLAFVLPKEAYLTQLTNANIIQHLQQKVPGFMLPTIRVVRSFPLLWNGRLNRHQLLNDYLEGRESGFEDWSKLIIKNPEAIEAGKILLEAMYKLCSIPIKVSIKSLQLSFYALGGTSCNTVSVVLYLNKQGFPISIQDFLGADTLEDLINLMENRRTLQKFRRSNSETPDASSGVDAQPMLTLATDSRAIQMYTSKQMEGKHRKETLHILSWAYSRHGELENISIVAEDQIIFFLNLIWERIMEQQMCFVIVRNTDSKIIGAAICFDFLTNFETDHIAIGPLKYLLDFGREIKGQFIGKLNENETADEIYDCFMMSVQQRVGPAENVRLTVYIVNEILRRALSDGFVSVFIASTNQLIRSLLLEIFGFKLVDDYVVNEYEDSEGIRPFHLAPGTLTMSSYLKTVRTAIPTTVEKSPTTV